MMCNAALCCCSGFGTGVQVVLGVGCCEFTFFLLSISKFRFNSFQDQWLRLLSFLSSET